METTVRTPLAVFNLPQQLQIPLFQRPYVWNEEDQWLPLWKDVQRLVELRLSGSDLSATHFLGAVVVQAHPQKMGSLVVHNIIDGQQRLTTLQLLADATGAVLEELNLDDLAGQLEDLTHNSSRYVPEGESSLKLRHTNRDRSAFDEVMGAELPIDYEGLNHSGSLITRAHRFFYEQASAWMAEPSEILPAERAHTLVEVLTTGIQLVAINLTEAENSQEIFETLNARGTPLTAADLIKNLVFQRLEAEGADTKQAYASDWPFETDFWEEEVTVGRHKVSRSSLFFNQWLSARTGEEVSPLATFNRFKYFAEHESEAPIKDLLPVIKQEADRYQGWIVASKDPTRQLTVVEMNVYRMGTTGVEVLMPLLIWLHSPVRALDQESIDTVVQAAESWVLRRQLIRLVSGDLGRVVVELMRDNGSVAADEVARKIIAQLSRLNVTSTYWPGDDEVRSSLAVEPAYRRLRAGRVRLVLESIEDRLRSETGQPQVARISAPVEHILPQTWETNWNVEGDEAKIDRANHVHRLGNLTLLTTKLNSKNSNLPWASKREKFKDNDTFLINSRLLDFSEGSEWNEAEIDARTAALTDEILKVWPVPDGHVGTVVDPLAKTSGWVLLSHLLDAGLLSPGTVLAGRGAADGSLTAVVTEVGTLIVDGKEFETPSAAAKYAKNVKSSNGWNYWTLPDGRSLSVVKREFTGAENPEAGESFDWTQLHEILEALPEGRWTSYGELADAIGTAPQPLGRHVAECPHCANAYRVLKHDGSISGDFAWKDSEDRRDPIEVLESEGVPFVNGLADDSRRLTSDRLAELVAT